MSEKKNKVVLYIEDEESTFEEYSEFLKRRFTTVITGRNGSEGYNLYITHRPDLVITDIQMPESNGIELIERIRENDRSIPLIVISGYANEPFITGAVKGYADYLLTKPVDRTRFTEILEKIFTEPVRVDTGEKKSTLVLPRADSLTIVGVGASAGGLEALTLFVKGLPRQNRASYIVAQHLSPTHKTMLVDLLARDTELVVKDAVHGEILEEDVIYITPPNKNIEITEFDAIKLSDPDQNSFLPKPSVNQLLFSIAHYKKDKGIGIILSGTGSDGAQGMRAINTEGGITIVQDPKTAKYDGMPVAAINGSVIDIVLEPALMGKELVELQNFPRAKVLEKHLLINEKDEMGIIFELLYREYKVDFSVYKQTTIGRRIERRMVASKVPSLTEYVKNLKENPAELNLLYKDILIGVTSFFRDPDAFTGLMEYMKN